MRVSMILALLVVVAACEQAQRPAVTPAATRGGGASERAPMPGDDGGVRRQTGEPAYSPLDEGGMGQLPEMPDQVSPAFRRM